jgi:hypothetical protein
VIVADTAFTACVVPTAPSELPDGATASFDAMRAARTAVTAYDSATTAYLNCLDTTAEQLAQQRQGAGAAAGLQALRSLQVSLHNTAVDTDHAVAERLNQQIRIYKAKHAP